MTRGLRHILLAAVVLLPVSAGALTVLSPACADDNGDAFYDAVLRRGDWRSDHVQQGPLNQGPGHAYVLASRRTGQQVVVRTEQLGFYGAGGQTDFRQMIESENRFSMQDVIDVEKSVGRQASVQRFGTRTCPCKLREEDEG